MNRTTSRSFTGAVAAVLLAAGALGLPAGTAAAGPGDDGPGGTPPPESSTPPTSTPPTSTPPTSTPPTSTPPTSTPQTSAPEISTPQTSGSDQTTSSYLLNMRAAALETFAEVPSRTRQQIGFSSVDLSHTGPDSGACTAVGAGYRLGDQLEQGALGAGRMPQGGGYDNPTIARDEQTEVPLDGANERDEQPGVRDYFPPGEVVLPIPADGEGVRWSADCRTEAAGSGAGINGNYGNAEALGSTTEAQVNEVTGTYTATSRSFLTGLTGAFDSISSLMQVTYRPDAEPTITFRLSALGADMGAQRSGINQNGFTLGGSEIPASMLIEQFNDQVEDNAAALSLLGPAGLRILAPKVDTSVDGSRFVISAPVVQGNLGVAARAGTVGQDQGFRFGTTTFEGAYQQFGT